MHEAKSQSLALTSAHEAARITWFIVSAFLPPDKAELRQGLVVSLK